MSAGNPMDRDALEQELEETLIKLALSSYAELEGRALLEKVTDDVKPSARERKRLEKAMDREIFRLRAERFSKKAVSYLNRAGLVLIVMLASFALVMVSVEAARANIFKLFFNMRKEATAIGFSRTGSSGDGLYIDWEDAYAPAYLPEGYEIKNLDNGVTMKIIDYGHKDNSERTIRLRVHSDGATVNLDTENADQIKKIVVNGNEGLYVRKNNVSSAVWPGDLKLFVLRVRDTELTYEEIIKVVESVRLVE